MNIRVSHFNAFTAGFVAMGMYAQITSGNYGWALVLVPLLILNAFYANYAAGKECQ